MKICPRCGSTNVDWIIPQNWSVWECKDCDYTGPIIEGDEKIAEEIKRDYELKLKEEKKKKNQNNESNKIKEDEENLSDEEMDKRLEELGL
jgi:Zn-finger protein